MRLYSEIRTRYAILLAPERWERTCIPDVTYDTFDQALLLITIAYRSDLSSSTPLFVILTLAAICAHSALVVRSDATWRHSGISPEHLTYQSRLPNRYFDAARDVDDNNFDRKSGHGGRPVDAIGLDMQIPKTKALSLPVVQHTSHRQKRDQLPSCDCFEVLR
jgi:hypothetical protein